jgi:hypothetical protein
LYGAGLRRESPAAIDAIATGRSRNARSHGREREHKEFDNE